MYAIGGSLSFFLTSLSGGNDVVALDNGRNGVGLNRSGILVATGLNVADHYRVKAGSLELNWIVSGGYDELGGDD